MENSNKNSKNTISAFDSLFDLLLWAEKRNPNALENVLETGILLKIMDDYQESM